MNDILARRARRATVGIALSAALVAGIAPATAIAAETSAPTGAVALQTEDAAAAKEKAYAAMQEALKNLEAAKDAASPEKIAEIDDDIAAFQELYDMVVAEAAKRREPLPAMQANVDAAQAKYDEAHITVVFKESGIVCHPSFRDGVAHKNHPVLLFSLPYQFLVCLCIAFQISPVLLLCVRGYPGDAQKDSNHT